MDPPWYFNDVENRSSDFNSRVNAYMIRYAVNQLTKVRQPLDETVLGCWLAYIAVAHTSGASSTFVCSAGWNVRYMLGHVKEAGAPHNTWTTEDGRLALSAIAIVAASTNQTHRRHFITNEFESVESVNAHAHAMRMIVFMRSTAEADCKKVNDAFLDGVFKMKAKMAAEGTRPCFMWLKLEEADDNNR